MLTFSMLMPATIATQLDLTDISGTHALLSIEDLLNWKAVSYSNDYLSKQKVYHFRLHISWILRAVTNCPLYPRFSRSLQRRCNKSVISVPNSHYLHLHPGPRALHTPSLSPLEPSSDLSCVHEVRILYRNPSA